MRKILLLALFLASFAGLQAQNEQPVVTKEKIRVVFQLTTNDTLAQKSLVKQLNNFLAAAPNAKLEVVCHNNGISFLQAAVSKQAAGIEALKAKGVDFVACANTLRERKIKPEELLPTCRITPSGVVEVALKQQKGWSYIKAGF